MIEKPKLLLNLYWHMHQPDYRDSLTGDFVLPWTYLHAIKDYSDMAFHLESNPKAKVSFNFVPILLDQLEDYAEQFKTGIIKDPILRLLSSPDLDKVSRQERRLIKSSCFKNYHEKMLKPYPAYQRLFDLHQSLFGDGFDNTMYLSGQYLADLIVWYHLAWMGESIKKNHYLVQRLIEKANQFDKEDRLNLFKLIGEIIADIIPRYKKLVKSGQIEISSTPDTHPILPLLLDFNTTFDAMPNASMPQNNQYAGGKLRARRHIEMAQISHKKRFGQEPVGFWPAEGAVSHAALTLMAEHGIVWAATGEAVLANSLIKSGVPLTNKFDYLYQPYRVGNTEDNIVCFFRDDSLSDKIGFEYARIHSAAAVSDFIGHLVGIHHAHTAEKSAVVSVILDGENAWEYYPYNGYYFLTELYAALAEHPLITMTTPSEALKILEKEKVVIQTLPEISAGSWVYGSFSTWIGSPDKNKAWDLLCEAKRAYDSVIKTSKLNAKELVICERQLAICEGSDWFWWFGDYNANDSVSSFDALYRHNLSNLYTLLKLPVPLSLNQTISRGTSHAATQDGISGAMRRGQESTG